MADLVVVIGVLAFFAISALLVIGCDRIIGPDTDALTTGLRKMSDASLSR